MQRMVFSLVLLVLGVGTPAAQAANLEILLPLGRTVYQTNEWIDLSVVRSAPERLAGGPLLLTLTSADGSHLDLTFAVEAVEGKPALATENLHLNGALLRPGKYTLEATVDGGSARTALEVYSHLRRSTFKTIDWASRAAHHEQAVLGEDSLGFNLLLYAYGGLDVEDLMRGRLDYMRNCALGGWHYMDLRRECDWSDPYVLGGAVARASRQTFQDRTNGNCLGVHLYDEALLAEVKDPQDPSGKRLVRYGVPAQERSFKSTFGREAPKFADMHFDRPEDVQRWSEFNRWRLLLLEAAWKQACFSITDVEPNYLPLNQTQWAWQAFDEGYYFNINRPFPVVSRHALYDYKYGGDFAPSFAFEFGRIRDLAKPNWYLPMWGCGHSDLFRAEQYLSFMNNVQGMAKAPDLLAHRPSRTPAIQGIVETNRTMGRLGTIFDTLPVTRPETAVLYSMSHNLHEQTHGRVDSYHGNSHFLHLLYLYMASKLLHTPLDPVVDEDVQDGTLARHHKVVLLAGIDYLDPKVLSALEDFATAGGKVLVSDDSRVEVRGSTRFHFPLDGLRLIEGMDRWAQDKQWGKWNEAIHTNSYYRAAQEVATALRPSLEGVGVKPLADCDQPGVILSRQAEGDIEYLFAVNATPDPDTSGWYSLRPVQATIGLPADGRPVYDALRGGPVSELHDSATGQFRFGPGQMRVLARTARPIGGVQLLTPLLSSDYTASQEPIRLEINAVVMDEGKQVLCGSAPLRIEVIDPLQVPRYDLYRATDHGLLRLRLPLAVNDPAGTWTVRVHDLLANTEARTTFVYRPATQCAALAGATRRAVCFGRDRDNIFRFFQTHRELTLATGSSSFDEAAAERLAESLKPWDFRCKVVKAADIKRRELTAEEKPTWVDAGGAFDVRGAVVLLGNPEDNPLMRHLRDQKFLPYAPQKDRFPGRSRGMLAWQRDGLAYFGQESLTLIGYDEAGLGEAVGSAYEIAAGLEPLTPRLLPDRAAIEPATNSSSPPPAAPVAWRRTLPDRVTALRSLPGGVLVLSEDGTLCSFKEGGAVAWEKTLAGGEDWALDASRDGNLIAVGAGQRLLVFDAGGKQFLDLPLAPAAEKNRTGNGGIGLVTVTPDGTLLLASLGRQFYTESTAQYADTLTLFNRKGERLWSLGGLDEKTGKPVLPEHYHFAVFSTDNSKIILLGDKHVQVVDAVHGTLGTVLEGSYRTATVLGENLLLADGDSQVVVFSPTQEKVLSRLDCGKAGPVALAAGAGGIVVGTEADGTVRLVKAVAGKLDEQTAWQDQVSTKVVKQVAVGEGQVAVSYWGGTLRVYDNNGQLRSEQVFAQDITRLAASGRTLMLGLADGSVIALATESR